MCVHRNEGLLAEGVDLSNVLFDLQIIQYQTVRYDTLPLSPISRNRLSKYLYVDRIVPVST